ncbi:hypothetical protein B0H63DRAFT_473393 [Podospora didyma]|uniref:Hemerythrin-like domain-containing protein n=1 Tax=Podospora didyma TaxID=330526 RepID=A0AAE0U037_9PEZI|nr:hypothetical protein B0H63DRAFT_473393 [Podospora didyma]
MLKLSKAVQRDQACIKEAFRDLVHVDREWSQDRTALTAEFVWIFEYYMIAEDLAVAPALDYYEGNGGERHPNLCHNYDLVNQELKQLYDLDPTAESWEASARAIWAKLEPLIIEETVTDLEEMESSMSDFAEKQAKKYDDVKKLLQKPYGDQGRPDDRKLLAMLEMPRGDLMAAIGVFGR